MRCDINGSSLIAHGANVVIADWAEDAGKALESELNSPRCIFHKTDVSDWDSVLSLFETTQSTFGQIDVVCANAGTNAWDNLLSDELDPQTGKLLTPNFKHMHVNLFGPMYTVKAAIHYLNKQSTRRRRQIIMTGSAASFFDTPPIYLYCAAKAGVLGFMRGLRTQLLPNYDITINLVAPWMTVTSMLPKAIEDMWGGLPANTPEGPARALLMPAVRQEMNGCSLFVAGNKVVELEEGLKKTQGLWMGEKLAADFEEGQRRLIPKGKPAFDSIEVERKAKAEQSPQ